jgi:carbonic anhydrase
MTGLDPEIVIGHMLESGVTQETIRTLSNSGMHLERWLTGFDNVQDSVERSVGIIKNHPLLPPGTPVHGMIIHPTTGKLDLVVDGYQ